MARLRIVTPCEVPWTSMPVREGGRFCDSCQKDVVDLSRLTERDALIVASLFAPGTLCGRLRYWADGTPRHAPTPTSRGSGRGATTLAVAMSAAVAGCHAGAEPAHPGSPAAGPTVVAQAEPNGDRDRDGIVDSKDLCPDEPEDRDGFEDEDGCPDPDNDHDRIPDALDKCPNEPETFNGFEDEDGCPDRGGGILVESDIKILYAVEFDRNVAKVSPKSAAGIDEVARIVRENPTLGSLVVRGFARKDEKSPKQLARQRAENVVAALVGKGADKAKLSIETPDVPPGGPDEERRVTFELVPPACAIPGQHQH